MELKKLEEKILNLSSLSAAATTPLSSE